MEEKTKNNGLIIVILLLLIVIVELAGFIVYDKVIKKEENTNTPEVTEKENKVEEKECPNCNCEKNLVIIKGEYISEKKDSSAVNPAEAGPRYGILFGSDNTYIFNDYEFPHGHMGTYSINDNKLTIYKKRTWKSDPTYKWLDETEEITIIDSNTIMYIDEKFTKKDVSIEEVDKTLKEIFEEVTSNL